MPAVHEGRASRTGGAYLRDVLRQRVDEVVAGCRLALGRRLQEGCDELASHVLSKGHEDLLGRTDALRSAAETDLAALRKALGTSAGSSKSWKANSRRRRSVQRE